MPCTAKTKQNKTKNRIFCLSWIFLCSNLDFFKKNIASKYSSSFFFFFDFSLGPYLQHMEVSRLGVELELQLPAYTTAAATKDP